MPQGSLPPWIIQTIGLALIVAGAIYWGFTGREPTVLGEIVVTLVLAGSYAHFTRDKRKGGDDP